MGSPSGGEKCLKGAYEHCAYILAGLGSAVYSGETRADLPVLFIEEITDWACAAFKKNHFVTVASKPLTNPMIMMMTGTISSRPNHIKRMNTHLTTKGLAAVI